MTEKNVVKVPFPVGLKITGVREMTSEEMQAEGWESGYGDVCMVLMLNDGSRIYASSDPEGNGPGCLYGMTGDNQAVYISDKV